jgi:CheY-like chemotaxis protein
MTATSKKVLIVDDEDVVCRSYERVLTSAGFEVAKAHSGPEALAQVRSGDFDVMLADLKMPGMDGLEVVSRVRETRPAMPVVIITGFPTEDTLNEAARLGVNDYLTKPVAPDMLTHATLQALTAPVRSESVPYDANLFTAARQPVAVAVPAPLPATVFWPERPVETPVRKPVRADAKPVAEAPVVGAQPGRLANLGRLAAIPFITLGYVLFLPFLGFALFFGLGAKAIAKKFAGREA